MSVSEVIARRDRGDWNGALTVALEVWRETRSEVVASAVDALDASQPEGIALPNDKSKFHALWMELAADGSVALRGRLARTVSRCIVFERDPHYAMPGFAARYAQVLERVRALAEMEPDPRIASALMLLVARSPFAFSHAHEAGELYGPILEIVERSGDRRQAESADALLARPTARSSRVRAYLASRLPELASRLRAVPIAALDDEPSWRTLVPPESNNRDALESADLLARILDDPDDDDVRLVYADWLAERGEPRGEFIQLQLRGTTKPARDKAASLLRNHLSAWLGPELATVLRVPEFRRGFLDCAALAKGSIADDETWERAMRSPALSTLRCLRLGKCSVRRYFEVLTSPSMISIERIEIPSASFLEQLLERPELASRLRFVESRVSLTPTHIEKMARAMPALEHLALVHETGEAEAAANWAAIVAGPLRDRLVSVGPGSIFRSTHPDDVAKFFDALPRTVVRLYHGSQFQTEFERRGDTFLLRHRVGKEGSVVTTYRLDAGKWVIEG